MLYLAADHRGFELKEKIKKHLVKKGVDFKDMGAFEYNKDDDYPDFAYAAAKKVAEAPEKNKAVLICGSGVGVAITANKVQGVYAAQVFDKTMASEVAEHGDVNAISFGADYSEDKEVFLAVDEFLSAQVPSHERHKRRVGKIKEIEIDIK